MHKNMEKQVHPFGPANLRKQSKLLIGKPKMTFYDADPVEMDCHPFTDSPVHESELSERTQLGEPD